VITGSLVFDQTFGGRKRRILPSEDDLAQRRRTARERSASRHRHRRCSGAAADSAVTTHPKGRHEPVATEPYSETTLPSTLRVVVKNVSKVASDPKAATRERLKAIGLLLRIAMGPSNRPAEDMDVVASRDARNALFDAAPFLEEIIKKSRRLGWNSLRAARLASRIGEIKR
jgi:hypothetical protein